MHDAETALLRRRLQDQEAMLRGVISQFASERQAFLPRDLEFEWRGAAWLLYAMGLASLLEELHAVSALLETALRETRNAAAALDDAAPRAGHVG